MAHIIPRQENDGLAFSLPQQQLEEAFAEFLRYPRALYLGSGYLANIAVLTALADRDNIIISDKLSHASSLDGITLSRGKHYRFVHNNFISLQRPVCFLVVFLYGI